MFSLHATRKLLERAKEPVMPPMFEPTTALGNWYGTVLFWRPQVALLVNEQTLYPIMLPLAPAATLASRVPGAFRQTLVAHGFAGEFVEAESAEMGDIQYSKTASRSVLGVMNEFSSLAGAYKELAGAADLVSLAIHLSETPCGPLYGRHISPDRELHAAISAWLERKRR